MNTFKCVSQSASLRTVHRVYLAESGQATLKFDARGRDLLAVQETGEKPFRQGTRPGG